MLRLSKSPRWCPPPQQNSAALLRDLDNFTAALMLLSPELRSLKRNDVTCVIAWTSGYASSAGNFLFLPIQSGIKRTEWGSWISKTSGGIGGGIRIRPSHLLSWVLFNVHSTFAPPPFNFKTRTWAHQCAARRGHRWDHPLSHTSFDPSKHQDQASFASSSILHVPIQMCLPRSSACKFPVFPEATARRIPIQTNNTKKMIEDSRQLGTNERRELRNNGYPGQKADRRTKSR
ncbi:hypothetical protein C8R44DRAFT_848758, partial [Mycena epipterygia]